MTEITQLLVAWRDGDHSALEQLTPLVYGELRRLARRQLGRDRGLTLQATAVVHEAYLKLIDQHSVSWQNRTHFFAIAARLMRRIVLERARARRAAKRGAGATHIVFDEVGIAPSERPIDALALEEALSRLSQIDPRQGEIVELRYFGGLSIQEVAGLLDISEGTVKREWRSARAWLHKEIMPSG